MKYDTTILFQVGGFDGTTYLKSIEMYEAASNQWKLQAGMNYRRLGGGVGVVTLQQNDGISWKWSLHEGIRPNTLLVKKRHFQSVQIFVARWKFFIMVDILAETFPGGGINKLFFLKLKIEQKLSGLVFTEKIRSGA